MPNMNLSPSALIVSDNSVVFTHFIHKYNSRNIVVMCILVVLPVRHCTMYMMR